MQEQIGWVDSVSGSGALICCYAAEALGHWAVEASSVRRRRLKACIAEMYQLESRLKCRLKASMVESSRAGCSLECRHKASSDWLVASMLEE